MDGIRFKMMGLCKSCFSNKYYGSSPDDRTADPDAQMLIVKNNSKPVLISSEPEPTKHEDESSELLYSTAKLEKCETGDSGTCIDDSFSKLENTKEKTDSNEELENPEEEHEKDLVQLTVSSVASLSGVTPAVKDCDVKVVLGEPESVTTQMSVSAGLELIPESGDTNLISLRSNPDSDKDLSHTPPQDDSQSSSRKGSLSTILRPIVKTRTSSFGQSCPPPVSDNNASRQFIVNKVPSKSILTG